jgi:Fe-S cluster assembly protein SufD
MSVDKSTDRREWYLASFRGFEKSLNGGTASALHQVRRAAIDCFAETGFPSRRDEGWRHTNIAPVARISFRSAPDSPPAGLMSADQLAPFTYPGLDGTQLVFVDGHFAPSLSTQETSLPPGVVVGSLAAALKEVPDLVEPHLGQNAPYAGEGFAALNTAFIRDGAFVYLPAGAGLDAPVHLLYLSTARAENEGQDAGDGPPVTYPRTLIVAEDKARGSVIESYVGLEPEASYLTNAVTEIVLGAETRFEHCKIQRESGGAYHVASLHVTEAQGCRFTSHNISLSGQLIRNDITTVLAGEGVESTLNGLYLASGDEHVDNHTCIEHASPDCVSHEFYKGVLSGQAHGVFRGKIHVHKVAQGTDAYQSNQNLLLSDDAQITSKPQLEIYADDVKCSHGSTTGQLDEDAIFYLRTRGLSRAGATGVLTQAFAGEILDLIGFEPVRDRLAQLVSAELEATLHNGSGARE